MSGAPQGRHVWYDLVTTDLDGAKDFYGAVAGWGTTPFEGGVEPYDMWTNGGRPCGGVAVLPESARTQGVPTHWMAHIVTPDVDATASRARELGGTVVVPPNDIPGVGRFSIVMDPFGAVFGAFAPAGDAPGPDGRPGPGDMSWHELMTDDYEKAFEFYADLFGWEKGDAMDMGEAGTYQLFREAGAEVDTGGMMNRTPEMPIAAWIYYINVSDLDAAVEAVGAKGGRILVGPMEVPGGDRVCVCMDPQGGAFALHAYASA